MDAVIFFETPVNVYQWTRRPIPPGLNIQIQAVNPVCPCSEGAQSPEHLIYDCKILEMQRKTLKHQIKTSGGSWPTTNSDLVAKYLQAFSRFIKSVDFYKLQ
jgi:hypothetical protein